MNSSGIKRGLAASAVAALAVTGIPALASSASAEVGDQIKVAYTGPALNGGDLGAVVVLEVSEGDVDEADLALAATNAAGVDSQNNENQTVEIVDRDFVADDAGAGTNEFGDNDGFDEITLHIKVTTPAAGDTATFRVFDNDAPATEDDTLEADEARAAVSIQTSGPVAQISVTPATQTAPAGVPSGDYTVTIKDSAGRATQLGADREAETEESLTVTTDANILPNKTITATEIERGSDTFKAVADEVDVYDISVDTTADTPTVPAAHATLDVVKSANLDEDEVDITTGADSWEDFGDGTFGEGNITAVRVDQSSIRIDIDSDDKNATVVLSVDGNGDVTFGGKKTTTVSTVLDSNGKGSLTITPDAGTIQEGDVISVAGAFDQDFEFQRAEPSEIKPGAKTYVSAIDGSVTVTATVVDQFGLPVTTGQLSAARRTGGPNPDTAATTQRKSLDASGQATFTFTDANAVAGQTDVVDFLYFQDQFDNSGDDLIEDGDEGETASTTIRYTTDGLGADFTTRIEGVTASGAGYDPTTNTIVPLADSVVNDTEDESDVEDEAADLEIVNAEAGAPITISVDGGALILAPGETRLSQGSASINDVVSGTGTLTGYRVIGTKAGLVTVTVTSANRTETAQFTVKGQTDPTTARNVTVSGPAQSAAGSIATFTAVVTDAFGNPIANVGVNNLNVQVTGPGALQDTGAATDANGAVALNVRLQDDAEGPVTITVTGIPGANNQFGAAANQLNTASGANSGAGLPASANSATATVTAVAPPVDVDPVNPQLNVTGKGGKRDRIKANAISDASGATATLWVKGKKVKTGTLNSAGDIVFKVKDKNGNKSTRYVVKISGTTKTLGARDAVRVR